MPRRVRFSEEELRFAIAGSRSWAETLRRLGYRTAGGNWRTLQKYASRWNISADHFDPDAIRRETLRNANRPTELVEIMVENSSYSRHHLKLRLFAEGVKQRRCERCGQGELWRERRMALILDHINGVPDDHRFENLRILCPNCAATLETHCARKNRLVALPRDCRACGEPFIPKRRGQRYCSRECGQRRDRSAMQGVPRPESRRVERPSYVVLVAEIERNGYVATGRKYGVSDTAIRKWVRFYENETARRGTTAG